ncbi:MAG: immunoglobulin domain-containing protein, partial [Verrucomicrobiota bacterium]
MPSLLPKLHPLATLFPFARVIGLLLLLSGVAVREIAAQPDITNIGGPYTTSEGRYIEVFLSARSGSEVTWQLQIPSRILTAEINPRFPSPATDGTAGYYRFGPMELRDSGVGVVIARNQTGSTTSLARYGFPLDVSVRPDRPEFGRETENLSVPAGAKATMLKRTYGALPMTLQWKKDGQNVPDATDETLTIEKTVGSDTGIYTLVATNKYGTTTSPASTLTVLLPASDVAITQQPPAALRVWVGQTATFQVAATGSGSLVYQWRRNGTPISGATAGTFFLPMVTVTDAGDYTVVVSNANGSLTSAAAVLTVLTPPEITRLPQSATVLLGAALSLQIEASGSAPLAY